MRAFSEYQYVCILTRGLILLTKFLSSVASLISASTWLMTDMCLGSSFDLHGLNLPSSFSCIGPIAWEDMLRWSASVVIKFCRWRLLLCRS